MWTFFRFHLFFFHSFSYSVPEFNTWSTHCILLSCLRLLSSVTVNYSVTNSVTFRDLTLLKSTAQLFCRCFSACIFLISTHSLLENNHSRDAATLLRASEVWSTVSTCLIVGEANLDHFVKEFSSVMLQDFPLELINMLGRYFEIMQLSCFPSNFSSLI